MAHFTRCGNFYGGGDLNWNRIVPGTIRSVVRGERPVIRSGGLTERDFLYVEDAAEAIVLALATVYVVWGSTYTAIRITDRTMPPLLMSSVRFLIAGTALYAFASRGHARPTLRQWGSAAIVGAALLLIGNGGVAWAETRLESGLAALMVAIIPLWVALMDRAFFGRRLSPVAIAGLVVYFLSTSVLTSAKTRPRNRSGARSG